MKRLILAVTVAYLFSFSASTAQLVYFDNFNQFANGTVLTSTNYVPGPWIAGDVYTEIKTNDSNTATATGIASNLFGIGNVGLFINAPAGSGLDYSARLYGYAYGQGTNSNLAAAVTNKVVDVQWLSWIQNTKSITAVGGFWAGITTTNVDIGCDRGCWTNYLTWSQPLLLFDDNGDIYAFTNNPGNNPPFPIQKIGGWVALKGTVMTNHLVLNYPAGQFTFSLNGTTLASNMTLSKMFTNILTEFVLGGIEDLNGSVGNKFALDNLQILISNTNRDVTSYLLAKGEAFDQSDASTVSAQVSPFSFHSEVQAVDSNAVFFATAVTPGNQKYDLSQDFFDGSYWSWDDSFDTLSELNAAYPDGTYQLHILGANQGLGKPALALNTTTYPNTPQIVNFDVAQNVDATADFTLQWNSSGGTATDFIRVDVADIDGNTVFSSPNFDQTNVLKGTATSVVIPANTLTPDTFYDGTLYFVKRSAIDTNTISGAYGLAAAYKMLSFTLETAPPPGPDCVLAPALATNDTGTVRSLIATVTTNSVPVSGVTVNFLVVTGPQAGTNGVNVTDGSGHASFSYTGTATGSDIIHATGNVDGLAFTGTAKVVWLLPNVPPVAVCQEVTVAAGANCQAVVSAMQVDDGSNDPDGGGIVSYSISPSGSFGLGTTPVTLTVVDNRGGSNSCSTTVTVVDQTAPTMNCPANIVTNVPYGVTSAVVNYSVPVSDNCSVAFTDSTPASGSTFDLGTNLVTSIAVDGAGNTNTCSFNIIVTQAPAQADLAVSGVSLVATGSLNNTFGYSFVVTNAGPQDAVNAEFEDVLPSGVSYSSSSSTAGICVFTNGAVVCDFDTLASGSSATISIIVTATATGRVCNTAAVTSDVLDPVSANNLATVCVPVVINDLAVAKFTAPKRVALSPTRTNVVAKLAVTIQNRGNHPEVIRDLATLSNLVTIDTTPIGSNACPALVAQVVPPKLLPITIGVGKKLKISYTMNFTCATDPLPTTKLASHGDYQYLVTVHHAALDGSPDSHPVDDACPHNALGIDPYPNGKIKDTGCGVKQPDGTFGPPVTDVVVNAK